MRRLFLLPLLFSATALAERTVSYNEQIRPILSDKCYLCHGPDEANNKAGLRLDTPEAAYAALTESKGHAIVPGDAANSIAYQRITSDDPNLIMPTPESNLVLTDEEKELIRIWIEEGAVYEQHWAFTDLPKSVEVPADTFDWAKSPIDHFVGARLAEEGLTPSEEAAPLRWLRRATFDLTGLPPALEDISAFQKDLKNGEIAYENAVTRMLESPAYGENMAVGWLDAARYADSYGYQSDKLNTQWPYRDWVIKAFNENLPYDDFVTWQLAGDLLENPTHDQRLATAFNRVHRLNNEGGAIFEEWRTENIADRVHTYGTAMLGLTMECTRCHDHKYDPITARDYFSIFAFFNSIDENGMYDRTEKVPSPTMLLPTAEQTAALERARSNRQAAESAYADIVAELRSRPITSADILGDLTLDGELNEQSFFSQDDHNKAPAIDFVKSGDRQGLTLDGDRGVTIKEIAPFDYWQPFTFQVAVDFPSHSALRSVIAHSSHGTDAGFNGWDLTIVDGHLEARLYRVWPGNGIGVRSVEPIPSGEIVRITQTYDGSGKAEGFDLFVNGQPLETEILRDATKKSASVAVQHGGKVAVGYRWRDRGIPGAFLDEVSVFNRVVDPALIDAGWRDRVQEDAPPMPDAVVKLTEARKAVYMAEEVMNEIPVMEELDEALPAYILARGEYDAPKTEDVRVQRDTFEHILPEFSDDYPQDRLGLAQWTVQPDHPLTSRVFVNRMWQRFFGQGIVDTPENFGLQGSLPSHPKLFDWLARDFVDNGWDIKRLAAQIVLSATYRQNSVASPELLERDPKNILLARGPAYRLAAEQIRDLALAASGLLNPERGGPPVSPYQPGEDLWRESNGMSPAYKQDVGKALYRRSLYSVWKRTAPLPNMMAFDSTTREVCTVARARTNTPLQALVLLNDVQFVEAARALAEKAIIAESEPAAQIDHCFLALTGRPADERETAVLQSLLTDQIDHYRDNGDDASALVQVGDSPANEDVPVVELAALTTVCQAILSLDAAIWRR